MLLDQGPHLENDTLTPGLQLSGREMGAKAQGPQVAHLWLLGDVFW